jgi:hypothetical protein
MVDCRRSPIEAQTFAAKVNVPILDATLERSDNRPHERVGFQRNAHWLFTGVILLDMTTNNAVDNGVIRMAEISNSAHQRDAERANRFGHLARSRASRGQFPIEPAAPPVPHPSRFRALALFGRRPPERTDGPGIPASENLHRSCHS